MTEPIGAVGAGYPQGIQPRKQNENPQQDVKQELKQKQPQNQESLVDASTTLDFMAQTSGVMFNNAVPTAKTINVKDYVTPEQAVRIAGFVTSFVDEVADSFSATKQEFSEMPDDMAMVVALAKFENDNY